MKTEATERDLIAEAEELNGWAILAMPPSPLWPEKATFDGAKRIDELLRRLVEENKRIANAFLIAYDLAGMDTHPLPEALPESSYTPGYMDKVRELRAVFAMIAARVKKENPDA